MNQKPSPEGIEIAMKHFSISDVNDVLYIGDSVFDCRTAENAKVDFCLVGWTPRKLPENARISFRINSFKELL